MLCELDGRSAQRVTRQRFQRSKTAAPASSKVEGRRRRRRRRRSQILQMGTEQSEPQVPHAPCPSVAHQKAASHGFTFPFTPLYTWKIMMIFINHILKLKRKQLFFFLFFFPLLPPPRPGAGGRLKAKERQQLGGPVMCLIIPHMVGLFQGIFVISDPSGRDAPRPPQSPPSSAAWTSPALLSSPLRTGVELASTSKPLPLRRASARCPAVIFKLTPPAHDTERRASV